MNKFMKIATFFVLFAGFTVAMSSCYRKKDTIAVITVVDSSENPVSGAEVILNWGDATREDLEQKATTDASGKATFNYNELYKSGQAGVFVLDVYVNEVVYGIIRVEQEETSEETIICTGC